MKKVLFLFIISLCTSITYAQVTNGLIAKYSFNAENTLDESGNANDGVGFNLASDSDRFGNANYSFIFNGDSSRIELPDSLLLLDSIAISLWFKTSTNGVIIGHQIKEIGENSQQWVPILYVREDSTLNAALWTGAPENVNDSLYYVNDSEWHHVVIYGNQIEQHVFIDNVHTGSSDGIMLLKRMIHNQIGNGITSGSWDSSPRGEFPFSGSIDDVRIYNRTLSLVEIDSLYNEPDPVDTDVLELSNLDVFLMVPNPTSGQLTYNKLRENWKTIELFDINGSMVLSQNQQGNGIDISQFPKGMYVLIIRDGKGEIVGRQKVLKK